MCRNSSRFSREFPVTETAYACALYSYLFQRRDKGGCGKRTVPSLVEGRIFFLHKPLLEAPELNICGSYAVSSLEKAEWKIRLREYLSDLLKEKPEAVCVSGDLFAAYPVMHQLRKKHIPVLTVSEQNGKRLLVRIPSGS